MKLTVIYDPAKDAENYVRSIFDSSYRTYGRENMKQRLLDSIKLEAVRDTLTIGTDREEVLKKITELLAGQADRPALDEKAKQLEGAWNRVGDQIIFQLEMLYGLECPFESVHIDLTTLQMCPYNFNKKQIFVDAGRGMQMQLRILSHELNHFFFYSVYAEELMDKMGKEKFELLKESVTIFTNPETSGYPDEQLLRKLFIEKRVRSLDEAVRVGVEFLL